MAARNQAEPVTKYQFQIDDDVWDEWKLTVPRDKSLEQRIIELIHADTEGRVTDVDLDALGEDLRRALEHNEWAAVEDAAARLGVETDE